VDCMVDVSRGPVGIALKVDSNTYTPGSDRKGDLGHAKAGAKTIRIPARRAIGSRILEALQTG
jgi:hypothetical protein